MKNNKKENKEFITCSGVLSQEELDEFVDFLLASGMKHSDIEKLGNYKGWYKRNESYKSSTNEKLNVKN